MNRIVWINYDDIVTINYEFFIKKGLKYFLIQYIDMGIMDSSYFIIL